MFKFLKYLAVSIFCTSILMCKRLQTYSNSTFSIALDTTQQSLSRPFRFSVFSNGQSHGHGLRLGSVSSTTEILNPSILCRRIGIYSNATEIYEEVVDDIKINFTCIITIFDQVLMYQPESS